MNTSAPLPSVSRPSGIRLNQLNFLFISLGLLIAILLIFSMIRTNDSFRTIVEVTNSYLSSQQSAGMLEDISGQMSENCSAFLRSGTPDLVRAYAGQYEALNAQLETEQMYLSPDNSEDEYIIRAVDAFRTKVRTEIHAMRLMADTLPMPLAAFPPLLQQEVLSDVEQNLPPAEKQSAALAMISTEEYSRLIEIISSSVADSHRISSLKGQNRAEETEKHVSRIMRTQLLLVSLFVIIALAALLFNRFLIIRPIQKSVDNLDRREPIPIHGSYEVRHMAQVYNDVLKDNTDKAAALSFAATHDPLTGLNNRAAFDKALKQYQKGHLGLIVADIDHFKQYNDKYGHDVGDQVLIHTAKKLQEHFRSGDFIARIGGDEFSIIMPELSHHQGEAIAEKIRTINSDLSRIRDDVPPITISAGIAFWDRPAPSGDIFKDADTALLQIKKTRATCFRIWPG